MNEEKDEWNTYTVESGLATNHVVGMAVDQDNVKWFTTMNGDSSFEGTNWESYGMEDGLVLDLIFSITVDNDNLTWIGTASGISSVSLKH